MTEALCNNNTAPHPHPYPRPAGGSQTHSEDSWSQQRESGWSERSINERDFLGDGDYEWLCGYGRSRHQQQRLKHLDGEELADAALYNELSCHVDATLAEVDMEHYMRQDIHRILEISGYAGDLYQDEKEQSSPLFSSTRDPAVFNTISMDSLDCSSYEAAAETIAQSCRTNMNNYTIAFEASMTSSANESAGITAVDNIGEPAAAPAHHSAGPLTTWSEQRPLQALTHPHRPGPAAGPGGAAQSKSMPDGLLTAAAAGGRSVPLYDVNHASSQPRDENSGSLLRLFIRQRHSQLLGSSCGLSCSELLTAPSDSGSDCPMKSESESEPSADTRIPAPARLSLNDPVAAGPYRGARGMPASLGTKSDSTSSSEGSAGRGRQAQRETAKKLAAGGKVVDHCIQTSASLATSAKQPLSPPKPSLYVCYPYYSMPNLQFLSSCPIQASIHLCPQPAPSEGTPLRTPPAGGRRKTRRPYSCNDAEALRSSNLSHIRDWGSLQLLLPQRFRQVVREMGYGACGGAADAPGDVRLHGGQCASVQRQRPACPHAPSEEPAAGGLSPSEPTLSDSQLKGILRRGGAGRTGSRACRICGTNSSARHSLHEPLQDWLHGAANFADLHAKDVELLNHTSLTESGDSARAKRVSFSESRQEIETEPAVAEPKMRLVFGDRSEPVLKSRTPSPSHPKRVIIVEKETFKGLLEPVVGAVSEIVAYFQSGSGDASPAAAAAACAADRSGGGRRPASGYLVLDRLCPALYRIVNHGLLTTLDTAFGQVPNCGWRLVESATSLGACPSSLQDLVMKLNNEEGLAEGVLKFNAFVFGLLNTQSLDSWFSYLRTRESIVRKHYSPEALLYHANCAARTEYDTLILQLQRLSQLQFNIDLMFESRMLYQSLGRLGERLEGLAGSWRHESCVRRRPRLARPRSTVDTVDVQGGDSRHVDKKRWSGFDLSSKLLQALDAILAESCSPNDEDDTIEQYERFEDEQRRDNGDVAVLDDLQEESEEDELVEDCVATPLPTALPSRDATAEPKMKQKTRPHSSSRAERVSTLTSATSSTPETSETSPKLPHKLRSNSTPRTNKAKFQKLQQQWETMAKGQTISRRESRIPRPVSSGSRPSSAADNHARKPSQIPKPKPSSATANRTTPGSASIGGSPTALGGGSTVSGGSTGSSGEASVGCVKRRSSRREARVISPKDEKDEENRAKGVRAAGSINTREAPGSYDANKTNGEDKHNRRVRSLSHYHASDRSYLSYNRHETLSVVGVVDKDWLLCARNERVGLVARKNVVDLF